MTSGTAPGGVDSDPTPAISVGPALAGAPAPGEPAEQVQRVYIHLGEPKTGTTHLQNTLWDHRHTLAEAGLNYPGPQQDSHWRASQDVLEIEQEEGDPAPPFTGEWRRLVAESLRTGHTAIISHELLAYATPAQAQLAMQSLRSVEVHLVLTVRDFASMVPAEWQEVVKHRNVMMFEEFLRRQIVTLDEVPDRQEWLHYWKSHSPLDVLANWAGDTVPPERVHVITMPGKGAPRDELWHRFASVVGIDPAAYPPSTEAANASLGIVEAEMLRRLNEVLPDSFPEWTYQWYVKGHLAHEGFPQRGMSQRVQLPAKYAAFAADETERTVNGLTKAGYHIVGDLSELQPRETTLPDTQPEQATPDDMLDAALYAITVLLEHMERMRVDLLSADRAKHGPVKGLLIALSERYPLVHRLRTRYWRWASRRNAR